MSLRRREFLKGTAAGSLGLGLACRPPKSPSADPWGDLSSLTEGVEPLPLQEYEQRLEKVRRLMGEKGVDALFVESGSSLLYFTGVEWGRSERMFAAIIPRQGQVAFICPAFERERAEQRMVLPEVDLRVWEEHESPFERARQVLQERGVRRRVALEATTRLFLLTGLREASPTLEWVDGQAITEGCRMVKSARELEYMRLANQITKRAYAAALRTLREGMTPQELRSAIAEAHQRLGASGGAMVLFGPHSAFPHGSREVRRLQEGDIILMDGGCSVQGYRSDVTRTTVFGQPSSKQREVWETVRRAQQAALEAARPGVPCQELDRVARAVIEEAGYGPGYRYFTHRLGHGIGLDGHEAPYLVEGNELPMQVGMTFSDEPGIYIYGEFGVRHEDIMVITEEGAEFLGEPTRSITEAV